MILRNTETRYLRVCGERKEYISSDLLYSLLRNYSPDQLQCYILDYSSHLLAPFERAPHVGGIIYEDQGERLGKFMHMMNAVMEERRRMFQGGNYSQYIQAYGQKIPAILIVIDNFGGFREKSGCRYDETVLRMVREGTGYGIYLAVTAAGYGISEIPGRIADNIRTVVSLEQSDKFKYMEVMRATRASCTSGSRGEGKRTDGCGRKNPGVSDGPCAGSRRRF